MVKAIDLTGRKFGRLTAIGDVGTRRSYRLWKFECECGALIERTTADVIHHKTVSCGCYQREMTSKRKSLDIAGLKFGRLVAVSRIGPDRHGHIRWDCICDCGNKHTTTAITLKKGAVRSCGCLQKEVAAKTQRAKALPKEEKAFNVLRSRKRQHDKRKTDPIKAMQARLSRLHRHAIDQVGGIKTSPTLESLGYTAEDLVLHLARQFTGGMGWHNMSKWQIDHIIPISNAKDLDDVVALNQLSNLRPMWSRENNAKKAKRLNLI